jgi:hypothetical protein
MTNLYIIGYLYSIIFLAKYKVMLSIMENVLRSTLSYPNETSKECIQFLIEHVFPKMIMLKLHFMFFPHEIGNTQ